MLAAGNESEAAAEAAAAEAAEGAGAGEVGWVWLAREEERWMR